MADLLTYRNEQGQIVDVGVKAANVPVADILNIFESSDVEGVLTELNARISNMPDGEVIVGTSAQNHINVADFKTASNTWTDAFELAFAQAKNVASANTAQYVTSTGSQNGSTARPVVIAPTGVYTITRTITITFGIDFDFSNLILKSTAPVEIADYDCFVSPGFGYRNHFKMPMFVGFRRCFAFSTSNRDTCVIKIEGGGAINCINFIDDISYQMVRSTQLEISNFVTVAVHQAIRVHTDDCHIHDGWIYSSGYNVSNIFSQSRLLVNNVIFIPKPTVEEDDNKMAWIEQWTYSEPHEMINYALGYTEDEDSLSFDSQLPQNKLGMVGANNRGVKITDCVFGGESGSMPAVMWEGVRWTNYSNSNALHNHIKITDCSIEAGNRAITQKRALVVIRRDVPSTMIFENLNGLSVATDGLVYVDSPSTKHHGQKWPYEFHIGPAVRGRESYMVTNDPHLYPFITVPFRPNVEIQTFKDLEEAKNGNGGGGYVPPETPKGTLTFNTTPNANITLNGQISKEANSSGVAVFTDIVQGTYNYAIARSGYVTKTGTVNLNSSSQTVNVTLVENGTNPPPEEKGTVTFNTTPNAVVNFNGTNITANGSGVATFTNVTYGDKNYTISRSGYNSVSGMVTVNSSTQTVNRTLTIKEDEAPPTNERKGVRYIRIGGKRSDANALPIAEIEAWVNGTNVMLGNQNFTVPEGTSRNVLTLATDGQRNTQAITLTNDSKPEDIHATWDLGQTYTNIQRINFLLYYTLTYNNVFISISEDGTNFTEIYRSDTLPMPTLDGVDINEADIYKNFLKSSGGTTSYKIGDSITINKVPATLYWNSARAFANDLTDSGTLTEKETFTVINEVTNDGVQAVALRRNGVDIGWVMVNKVV